MDPDTILAERDAWPVPPPGVEGLRTALQLAQHDAAQLGQPDVRPANLLVGLLRDGGPPLHFLKDVGGLDVGRFRADLADRVAGTRDGVGSPELPMHADADAALTAAIALATERRAETVNALHLLHALTRSGHGAVAELLARYGVSATTLSSMLARGL